MSLARILWMQAAAVTPPSLRSYADWTGAGGISPVTCNVPTGVVDGDYLVAVSCYSDNSGTTDTMTAPAGWSVIVPEWTDTLPAGSCIRSQIWGRVASSEPASYSWTHGGLSSAAKLSIFAFQNCSGFDVAATGSSAGVSGTSITYPSITVANASSLLFLYVGMRAPSNTSTPPAGFTEIMDYNSANGPNYSTSYKVPQGAGATGTFSGSISVSQAWCCATLALKP